MSAVTPWAVRTVDVLIVCCVCMHSIRDLQVSGADSYICNVCRVVPLFPLFGACVERESGAVSVSVICILSVMMNPRDLAESFGGDDPGIGAVFRTRDASNALLLHSESVSVGDQPLPS